MALPLVVKLRCCKIPVTIVYREQPAVIKSSVHRANISTEFVEIVVSTNDDNDSAKERLSTSFFS